MLSAGLVSVSFRQLSPEAIIRLCKETGLSAIEWGGDVHVPPENTENARAVGALTRESGLQVASYGSYYRLGENGEAYQAKFASVLAAAKALGAPVIRIWAGTEGSAAVSVPERARLAEEARALAEIAAREQILLAFECHPDTLTDTPDSSLRLMEEIRHPNLRMYWQPNNRLSPEENLSGLRRLLPDLLNIHVFHWPAPGVREPLKRGEAAWLGYLSAAAGTGKNHLCMLEFMPDDDPASLRGEAAVLLRWLNAVDP